MIEIERFRAGSYVKSGAYRCFVPSRVSGEWSWETPEINKLLELAAAKLGELNAYSHSARAKTAQLSVFCCPR